MREDVRIVIVEQVMSLSLPGTGRSHGAPLEAMKTVPTSSSIPTIRLGDCGDAGRCTALRCARSEVLCSCVRCMCVSCYVRDYVCNVVSSRSRWRSLRIGLYRCLYLRFYCNLRYSFKLFLVRYIVSRPVRAVCLYCFSSGTGDRIVVRNWGSAD